MHGSNLISTSTSHFYRFTDSFPSINGANLVPNSVRVDVVANIDFLKKEFTILKEFTRNQNERIRELEQQILKTFEAQSQAAHDARKEALSHPDPLVPAPLLDLDFCLTSKTLTYYNIFEL